MVVVDQHDYVLDTEGENYNDKNFKMHFVCGYGGNAQLYNCGGSGC